MGILERFSKKPKPQEVILTSTPQVTDRSKTAESYPDTMVGVFHRLKRLARTGVSLEELQTESTKGSQKLLELCRDGVEKLKQRQERSGEEWKGKISLGPFLPIEQDGLYSGSNEGVDVKEECLMVFSSGYESCGDVTEDGKLRVDISPDYTTLYSASYNRTKVFSGERVVIEDITVKFDDNQVTEIFLTETPPVPVDYGSFYKKPEGLTAELQVRFKKV